MSIFVVRHPTQVDSFLVDYTADLADGEALDGVPTHTSDDPDSPASLTLTPQGLAGTGSPVVNVYAQVGITGGVHGRTYKITSTAATTEGRTIVKTSVYTAFNG